MAEKKTSDESLTDESTGKESEDLQHADSITVASQTEAGPPTERQPFGEKFKHWYADNFDINVGYLKSVRGILNICQVVLSLLVCSLLTNVCRHTTTDGTSFPGFYCKSSDTFAFVIGCSAFIQSIIFVMCCFFSEKSANALYKTIYELTYYVAYSFLFLVSSLNLLSNVYSRNSTRYENERGYGTINAAAVLGLLACVSYGMSALCFLGYHKISQRPESYNV
ncbi:uncharacterized protein [Parasteatoda tepidariorum]|nr:uncharacterized protein LOC107443233 isoform X2 [Parasteatoda tepidariorum]XP_015912517.1 uncharacterized protein LOC107443233 isoform X2 [Parasteatoda tepidariorum]XP_015912518.1 uncharacterized protein LOC107443233 isoform X2 [Parasteatoda tepidariorum]